MRRIKVPGLQLYTIQLEWILIEVEKLLATTYQSTIYHFNRLSFLYRCNLAAYYFKFNYPGMDAIKVLVVGCGNMGASHARAYHELPGFEICGLVSRGNSKKQLNASLGGRYPLFDTYEEALDATQPHAVCISTYPDTHENFALLALEQGCHVFMEKPVADSVLGAERVVEAARKAGK